MRHSVVIRCLLLLVVLFACSHSSFAQVAISVSFGPPPIPVYEQPICPTDGYIWVPGYWDYDDADGYFWVPGTWVAAPEPGFLWTPGYWGWGNGAYLWHAGYWGPHVGFYGGINYGFGYFGNGYEGGRWENGHFFYNTEVNRVNVTVVHNVYKTTIVERNNSRVAYNGGEGGINARASAEEERYAQERHVGRVAAQEQHVQAARSNPELRASANRGKPPIAATERPNDFHGGAVPARQAGGEYKAPPPNAAHNGNRPPAGNEAHPNNHASDLQAHQFNKPNTGDAKLDAKYQKQQQQLAAKQNADHQKLQQQQEKEHQAAMKKTQSDAQKQQMEQRHMQQTQTMEQKHSTQQQHMEQRQTGHPAQPKPTTERH